MNWLDALFLLGNAFFLYVTLVFLLTYLENSGRALKNPKPKRFPSASVVIPAFNEEETIAATMAAVSRMRYPKRLEIIVVDDGSKDATLREARAAGREIEKTGKGKAAVRVLTQRNAGKAAALNAGIRAARGELVATVDADSFPHEDALLKMVGYFNDERVDAVTASVKIHSPHSFLQLLQYVEYVFMNFLRKAASFMQGISCVPGPLSVFRASVFKRVGGFDEGNITEDTEIALRMQKNGMRIENALDAVVECETPYSVYGLVKQRVRWYHGALLNAEKYSHLFFDKSTGAFGWFVYPANFILTAVGIFVLFRAGLMAWERLMQLAFGVATNAGSAAAAVAAGAGTAQAAAAQAAAWWTLPLNVIKIVFDPSYLFTVDIAFVVIYSLVIIFALRLSFKASGEKFKWKLVPVYVSYLFVYSFLVALTWVLSVFRFFAGAKPTWTTTKTARSNASKD